MDRRHARVDISIMDRDGEGGFSLIELLAVIVVLGVLAAIAIPVLLHQRDKASRAVATSDLRSVRTSQALWLASDQDSYTDDLSDLATMGYRRSDGIEPPVIKIIGSGYLACVRHVSMSDWLVFSSATGRTSESTTNDCA